MSKQSNPKSKKKGKKNVDLECSMIKSCDLAMWLWVRKLLLALTEIPSTAEVDLSPSSHRATAWLEPVHVCQSACVRKMCVSSVTLGRPEPLSPGLVCQWWGASWVEGRSPSVFLKHWKVMTYFCAAFLHSQVTQTQEKKAAQRKVKEKFRKGERRCRRDRKNDCGEVISDPSGVLLWSHGSEELGTPVRWITFMFPASSTCGNLKDRDPNLLDLQCWFEMCQDKVFKRKGKTLKLRCTHAHSCASFFPAEIPQPTLQALFLFGISPCFTNNVIVYSNKKSDKDEKTVQRGPEDRPVKSGDGAARAETPGIMGKECNIMTPLGWVQLKALRIAKNKHLKRTECTHKGFNSPLASSTHTYTLLLFPVPTYWSLLFFLAACRLQMKSTLSVPHSFLLSLLAVREMLMTSSEGTLRTTVCPCPYQ